MNLFARLRPRPSVEVFEGGDGRWYFHRKTRNRISDESQGYATRASARRAAARVWPDLPIVNREVIGG